MVRFAEPAAEVPLATTSHEPEAVDTLSSPHATVGTVVPSGSVTGTAAPDPVVPPTPLVLLLPPPQPHARSDVTTREAANEGTRSEAARKLMHSCVPPRGRRVKTGARSEERGEDALHVWLAAERRRKIRRVREVLELRQRAPLGLHPRGHEATQLGPRQAAMVA